MIIWGTKHVESKRGRMAEFCPMCRKIRAFTLIRTNAVSHIYYVPIGRGQTIAFTGVCETCGHAMQVDPVRYTALAPKRSKDDVRKLVRSTFPGIVEYYSERLELEEQLRKSPESVAPEVREELIRESLQNSSNEVEQIYSTTNLDWRSGVSFLGAIAFPVVVAVIADTLLAEPRYGSLVVRLAVAGAGLGLLSSLYFAVTSNRRRMRATVLPRLVTALRPLRPREAELDVMLARFKAAGLKIGKKLSARELCQAIDPTLVKEIRA